MIAVGISIAYPIFDAILLVPAILIITNAEEVTYLHPLDIRSDVTSHNRR